MTVQQLKELFKKQGWTFQAHSRRTQGKQYVYASRRIGETVKKIYVATLASMETMDEQQALIVLKEALDKKAK